jgi:release factor glutamine methyltransferase
VSVPTTQVLRRASAYLDRHGVASPEASAEALLMHVVGVDRASLFARGEGLSPDEARRFGRALCRRCAGTPLQHLTREQAFRRLSLEVRPGVFVPRPETEIVVDHALAAVADVEAPVVLDIGTGTGAIALALADERPDARVLATDRSSEAVALARANAERLGLDIRVEEGDGFEPLASDLRGRVDLVVSNPPYLEAAEWASLPADVRADPRDALIGGIVVLERLAVDALGWLRPGGSLVLEIGQTQGGVMRSSLAERYDDVRVERDLTGRDRVAIGRAR